MIIEKKFIAAITLTMFSGLAVAAADSTAQSSAGGASMENTITVVPFESLDTNSDGYLDRQEAQTLPILGSNFDEIEFDGDDRIDRQGYYAVLTMLTTGVGGHLPSYGVLDVNRDGTVSESEYDAFQLRVRQLSGAMRDGKLSFGLTPTPNTMEGKGHKSNLPE